MSTQASSIPAAIRDRTSASAQPHVWTPEEEFADLGRRHELHLGVGRRELIAAAQDEARPLDTPGKQMILFHSRPDGRGLQFVSTRPHKNKKAMRG